MILAVILIVFLSISVASTSELSDAGGDLGSNGALSVADAGDDSASNDDVLSVADDSDSGSSDKVTDSADDKKSSPSSKSSSDDSESEDDDGSFPDCNLTITKEGDKKVKIGDEVEWKITLKNEVDTAWNIHVNEKLPKNFDIVSVKASKGEYNEEMSHWEITKLKKGESATLTIKAKAKKEGNYTNKAEVFTDSNNLNENDTAEADVEVVKDDSKAAQKKSDDKKEKVAKETKKVKDDKKKINKTKTNATNQTNHKKVDLKNAGNPIMVMIISLFAVLGLGVLRKE